MRREIETRSRLGPLGTYPVEKGRVLILDNELHEETIASRIPRVAEVMKRMG